MYVYVNHISCYGREIEFTSMSSAEFTSTSSAGVISVTHISCNPSSSSKTGSSLNDTTLDTSCPSVIDSSLPVMLSHPSNSSVGTPLMLAVLSLISTSPGDCQVMSTTLDLLRTAQHHRQVLQNGCAKLDPKCSSALRCLVLLRVSWQLGWHLHLL